MFATRYFCARYFAPRYFPKVGAAAVAAVGGPVWVWVNGVSAPPVPNTQGSQPIWLWVNGTIYIPASGKPVRPMRPRRRDERG